MRFFIVAFALLLAGCPKPAPTPPTPDAGDGGPPATATCETLCKNLADKACPEGDPALCVPNCQKLKAIANAHEACGTDAKDQAAIRACGFRCDSSPTTPR